MDQLLMLTIHVMYMGAIRYCLICNILINLIRMTRNITSFEKKCKMITHGVNSFFFLNYQNITSFPFLTITTEIKIATFNKKLKLNHFFGFQNKY